MACVYRKICNLPCAGVHRSACATVDNSATVWPGGAHSAWCCTADAGETCRVRNAALHFFLLMNRMCVCSQELEMVSVMYYH